MLLFEEIVVEILMIAAVVVAVGCLAHLLQLSVREQVYLRRLRREREEGVSGVVRSPEPRRPQLTERVSRDGKLVLREKHI